MDASSFWDADNYFHGTTEAVAPHRPKQSDGAVRYVEVEGQSKIAIEYKIYQ